MHKIGLQKYTGKPVLVNLLLDQTPWNFVQIFSTRVCLIYHLSSRLHDNKTTNSLRIAIYPGKFKFVLVKTSPDSERLHGRHAKENQTLVTFFTAGI